METFITVVLVLVLISWFIGRMTKSVQVAQQKNKCRYCGTRLKTNPTAYGYADHCHKCGREQPWAKAPP